MTEEIYGNDVLATPELETPPAEPEAHQGRIEAVTLERFESGATAFKINLSSANAPLEDHMLVFLPKGFVENISVNPKELPEEDGNKQQTQYRIAVANSTKDATMQSLREIAFKQGRTLEGAVKPTDIEEYAQLHNSLLAGVEVVFTRNPDAKNDDPRFKNRLRVTRVMDIAVINKPKSLKKFRKCWEG